MLFEVAMIEMPTKEDAEKGKLERLILAPTAIIARDTQTAAAKAMRDAKIECDLDRVEVLVRPFK